MHYSIDPVIAEADMVAALFTWSGTNLGPLVGLAPRAAEYGQWKRSCVGLQMVASSSSGTSMIGSTSSNSSDSSRWRRRSTTRRRRAGHRSNLTPWLLCHGPDASDKLSGMTNDARADAPFRNVIVALDGSERSEMALVPAVGRARPAHLPGTR